MNAPHHPNPPTAPLRIRPERPADAGAVAAVLEAAFPTPAEARLVELLRAHGKIQIALVAEVQDQLVGCLHFSPVSVAQPAGLAWGTGLAPLAVRPTHQRQGIGKALVEAGLTACRQAGYPFAVVLGPSDYYHRFGFTRADTFGLGNEYGAHEMFMALELKPAGLPQNGGLVKYAPEFAELAV